MSTNSGVKEEDGLEAVLVEVLESEEQGHIKSLEYWAEKHPKFTQDLHSFFTDRAAFDGFLSRPFFPESLIGENLRYFGDYELLNEIARGGMGVIYRAKQKNLNRIVALKMILGGRFSNPADLDRFRNEAQAISQLDHPGIVPLYEIGEHQGHHYFTMKLIAGGSLASRISLGLFAPSIAAKLIAMVARAVHYAHQRGILHRDLKPANILLESAGNLTPLVADFGLSKPLDGSPSPTHTGAILGTPAYMAPEQARAEKQLTTAVDVYSLGAILYELITGQAPFKASSVAETLDWLQNRDPVPPRHLNPRIDRDLETITLKCLAKKPQDRYGSAETLAEDLERWQRGKPIHARPVGTMEYLVKWARRKPTIAGLVLALTTLLIVGITGMAWLVSKTRDAEREARLGAEAEATEKERALAAEKRAEVERDRAEESLYFNRISSAYRYWQDGNLNKADDLLKKSPEKYRNWEWQHLQKLMNPEESSIPGYGFKLTTDQKRMFVFHYEMVALWDVKTWKEIKSIPHQGKRFATSPDGTRYSLFSTRNIETGTQRAITVQVFETETGKLIWENANLPIKAENIRNVIFSPDNKIIAVCGTQANCAQGGEAGSTTLVLDGETGATKYTLKQGGLHAAFSPDGKTLAVYEERMELDRSQRDPLPGGVPIQDGIIPCSWHWPTGENLHFGDRLIRRDSWIHLLEPATGQSKGKLTHPEEGLGVAQDFSWSPDGKQVASLQRGVTDIFDVGSRKHFTKLLGHKDGATTIAYTKDPNMILTGGIDHTIKLWNLKEGKSIREWRGHKEYVSSLALIDNGRTLLSGSGDRTIRRWRFHQTPGMFDRPSCDERPGGEFGTLQYMTMENGAFHWAHAFNSDGSKTLALDDSTGPIEIIQALLGSCPPIQNYRISLMDSNNPNPVKRFPSTWQTTSMSHHSMKMEISPDERFGAACFRDQPVLLDLKTGTEHFLPFRSGSTLSFSPDGKTLATVQHMEQQVYNPGQPVKDIPVYLAPPPEIVPKAGAVPGAPLEFSTGGTDLPPTLTLPNFSSNSFVRFWDVNTRKEIAFVALDQFSCDGISFSPDRKFLAGWGRGPYQRTGNSFNAQVEIRLIDLTTHTQIHVLKGSGLNHRDASFSPDGKLLTAASWDGNVYVWEVATGQLLHTLRGHQGYVWSSCFSPDGTRVISSGNDGTLKVWDTASGEEIVSFTQEGGNFQLKFSPSNQLTGVGPYFHRTWLSQNQ